MKTVKVLDLNCYVHLICIMDKKEQGNPFRLYIVYKAIDKYSYPTQHKKLLAKYGNMESVLCHIKDLYFSCVQYKPIDDILAWNRAYYRRF